MSPMSRKTKIIATLGPATDSPEMLRELMLAGANVFRLNMSHAKHDWVRSIVKSIRDVSAGLRKRVGILMDTQGPAIRTGDLPSKLNLQTGDVFTFTVRGARSEEEYSVDVNYDGLVDDIQVGDVVKVDNGVIEMKVLSKDKNKLRCEVLTPGEMGSRRHINLPGVKVNLPAMTEKDKADVKLGAELKVDYVALSFVREAADIGELRALLEEYDFEAKVIAKIEDQSAVRNIRGIMAAADAIMVARGDLGVEVPYEELPIIQRRIVKSCVQNMKPVVVATHMLESMIENPIPTRAEITDVANAVFEQADAIMLSGETTVGKYPKRCVEVLDRVAARIENSGTAGYSHDIEVNSDRSRVVASAVHLADKSRAAGIIVFTRTGHLAALTAALRPRFSSIFAFAHSEEAARRLSLNFGVTALFIDFSEKVHINILDAEKKLKARQLVKKGDRLVVISDLVVGDQIIQSSYLRLVD
ncbi:MAG: pyruvate kinase [Verrucomicrobiota bacterium]